MLKERWGILRSPSFYPVRTQGRIVMACCLLHNLIRRYMPSTRKTNDDDEEDDDEDDDDDDDDDDEMDDDDDLEDDPQYIEVVRTIQTSHFWTNYRNQLALGMYNEWRNRS